MGANFNFPVATKIYQISETGIVMLTQFNMLFLKG